MQNVLERKEEHFKGYYNAHRGSQNKKIEYHFQIKDGELIQDRVRHMKPKGLVIFNPAVGGWSRGEGGQKYLRTCLRRVKDILYFL